MHVVFLGTNCSDFRQFLRGPFLNFFKTKGKFTDSFNHVPDHIFLVFASNDKNVAEKMTWYSDREENNFSFFHNVFQKGSFLWIVKTRDCVVKS